MPARLLARLPAAIALVASLLAGDLTAGAARADGVAKELFGAAALPNRGQPASVGFYAKGCLSGGVAIPSDGPTWQAMRLSRNRRWGNPQLIQLLERFSQDAARLDGWNGLLLGDISQPRGGPMKSGHASHQIGLDADIWLTPMPNRTLTPAERENISATSMLKPNAFLTVDDRIWTKAHARVIMRAASYPQVERIFVNPAIKKKLCETWTGDRSNLGKVRPYYGHDYHFHIRLHCPPGASNCKAQAPVALSDDGCGKSLAWWFTKEPWAQSKPKPGQKPPKPPRPTMLSDLPKACTAVLGAASVPSESAATFGGAGAMAFAASAAPEPAFSEEPPAAADAPAIVPGADNPALPEFGPYPYNRP